MPSRVFVAKTVKRWCSQWLAVSDLFVESRIATMMAARYQIAIRENFRFS